MGSTSNPAVTNNTFTGGNDASWASVFSFMAFPQWYPELVKRYGAAFEVFEFLKFAGQETTCAGQTKTMFEVGSPERYVTTHQAITTVQAGVNIQLTVEEWADGQTAVAATNGVTGKCYLSAGDKVAIPAEYCTVNAVKCTMPQWYQVASIATPTAAPNNNDTVITCTPLNALTLLGTQVPAATKLMVTGGNYAAGSTGAKSKTQGYYQRTFTTAIKRTRFEIEGSQQSNERYTDHLTNGGMGVFSEASLKAEFRHNQALNYEILLGNTADNLTMANRDSVSSTVRGTIGIMPHLDAGGCKQYYTNTYTIPDFDMVKKAFISQGVVDKEGAFFGGAELLRGVENNNLDFIKEYAGGSVLFDNISGKLQTGIKVINKNGITLSLHELVSFSNPNTLGNYGFDKKGFIIPNTQVTVRDSELGADVKMANLTLAYKSYNGENRERIFKVIPGVSGLSQVPGNFAVDNYDSSAWEILSEFMLLFAKRNQSILIQPDSVL